MKILAVDDSDVQLRILRMVLKSAGHEVVEAINGQVAWELLQKEHIRLVITDWMMPTLTGPELIRRIRAANWASYTYIILLTSQDTKDQVVAGLNAGADDYVTKPFDPAELVARLGIAQRILDLEARLAAMARQDLLTGLFNRRALYETLQAAVSQATREASPLSLILVDLDHFKLVNDQYGHPMGDQVLQRVAEILRTNKRAYDSVGRWGGEEFLMVLPNTNLDQAVVVAERLRALLASIQLPVNDQTKITLSASLGITSTQNNLPPFLIDSLLKQADEALYQAKGKGRNCVCVFTSPSI
ncbi:MAG: diguanylate cyclase [Nitrospirae bacterium]|nr:diguanylate cyclase [Nitrospirota bacterium]